jgi:DNA-3-methyladenine glycosylase II
MQNDLQKAANHLSRHDPILTPIIKHAGLPTLKPHRNYYWELVDSIISQQLSVKAAASIEKRFRDLFGKDFPEPDEILARSVEELRSVGLSRPKANYIRDLAQHIVDGKLKFDRFDQQSNHEIIAELTDVKGIGEWTAHMFLIFCMGRLDILATGDLGIKNGIRKLYGFEDIPTPEQIEELATRNHWHPYESVACWYIWHSLDNKPG